MLTRSGVAKRLKKSIATVRRIEGVHLHPMRDDRGFNLFDPLEVESLACAISRGDVQLPCCLATKPSPRSMRSRRDIRAKGYHRASVLAERDSPSRMDEHNLRIERTFALLSACTIDELQAVFDEEALEELIDTLRG